MGNDYFQFKQFIIRQDRCAMKVTTDACLFGAWTSEYVKKYFPAQLSQAKALDIGTGTGFLSLMLAQKNPSFSIDAIEIDKESMNQAVENVMASPWRDKINVMNADAREFISTNKYEIIISNPPFYEHEINSDDERKNIAHHHTGLRLDQLLRIVKSLLHPNGKFFLLLPYKRINEIEKAFVTHQLFIQSRVLVRQTPVHSFFRIMLCGSSTLVIEPESSEITIKDGKEYTSGFITLLKDYYLNL